MDNAVNGYGLAPYPRAAASASIPISTAEIISSLPLVLRYIIYPLSYIVKLFLVKDDKESNIHLAEENLSDGECVALLRSIGASSETLKTKLRDIGFSSFDEDNEEFERETANISQMNELIESIINFCSNYSTFGRVNRLELKAIILNVCKQLNYESEQIQIDKELILPVFNENFIGVLKLNFKGYQELKTTCCFSKTKTELEIKKTTITFMNKADLLSTLKGIINAINTSDQR